MGPPSKFVHVLILQINQVWSIRQGVKPNHTQGPPVQTSDLWHGFVFINITAYSVMHV